MLMTFLEKDLEQIIFEAPINELNERGLQISGKRFKQLFLGNYGRADIVTFDKHSPWGVEITIFEFKQEEINWKTFVQGVNYSRAISHFLALRKVQFSYAIDIVLVGKKICNNSFCYLPNIFNNISLYTYKYDFDGISFNREVDFTLQEHGFPKL